MMIICWNWGVAFFQTRPYLAILCFFEVGAATSSAAKWLVSKVDRCKCPCPASRGHCPWVQGWMVVANPKMTMWILYGAAN